MNTRNDASSTMYHISAVKYGSLNEEKNEIVGTMWYQPAMKNEDESSTRRPRATNLSFDKLILEDRKGNR